MHEYSIVQALLERVTGEAQARGASKVVGLRVRLGELSGVDPALLATAFETFRERSVCEGASLAIERAAASWAWSWRVAARSMRRPWSPTRT